MRRRILLVYKLLSYLILLVIFLAIFSFALLDTPSNFFKLLQTPLEKYGIKYGKMEGSFLTGVTLHNVNYQEKIKAKKLALKIDFNELENRLLYVENIVLEDLEIEENFLADLIDNNSSDEVKEESNITLPFDQVIVKNMNVSLGALKYESYLIKEGELHIDNFESDLKGQHKGNIKLKVDSNVGQANLDIKIVNDRYSIKGKVKGEKSFINQFTKNLNINFNQNPKLKVLFNGNVKALDYEINGKNLSLNQNEYSLHSKVLKLKGHYDLERESLKLKLIAELKSNVADFKIDGKTNVNLKDINNSLDFNLKLYLEPKEKLFTQELQEQNITLESLPKIELFVNGDLKKSKFNVLVKGLKVRQNEIELNLKDLLLNGEVKALKGDTKVEFLTHFDSSVASGMIEGKTALNFNDVNNSLLFDVKSKLQLEPNYINNFLTDSNVTLSGNTPLNLTAKGDMQKLKVKVLASTQLLTRGIVSTVNLKTQEIELNLKEHTLNGALSLDSKAKNIALDLKSRFEGDYVNVEKLKINTVLNLKSFNAFGVNLNSLTPLNLKADNNMNGMFFTLNSKKIQIEAQSKDLKVVKFTLNTKNIYPSKIVDLPPELDENFIRLKLKGLVNLSDNYVTLKGALLSNKNFKVNINAINNEKGLDAKLSSQHFKLQANGDIKTKNIKAKIEIYSLKKLQKELNLLYEFETLPVEGALEIDVQLKAEEVLATLHSSKLKFKGFNAEDIAIDAYYAKALLVLNKLSFKTTGFKKSSLNKKFYLNKKGYVHLGEKRDVLLDLHPKILIKAKGTANNLKATLQIEALPLGYPEYGDVLLSCDLDYIQALEKKNIKGGIFLDKVKLFYESKYLDSSVDNDVIIVRKKDKKKRKEKDTFLEDTAVDVSIYTSDANYKTRDIDLKLTVNLKAQKEFGKTLRMLGRIKEINGRVEQSPKFFSVVDSNIVFQGRKEINPLLDLIVEHELPDILITIHIHGNVKRPKLTFTSEPPLPKKDILSYLLLGVSTAGLGEGKGSLGREAQIFIMNQAARDLAYEVELDRVFVKDDGTGEGYAVQVGKKVGEDSMIILENSKEGNSFIIEYDVSKNIKLEVGHHQKIIPSQSIDIYFRKRFK